MIIFPTSLADVIIVQSPVHHDDRGFFIECFVADQFAALGLPTTFAQDNHSRSTQWVLRGLHYQLQQPQGKLIRPAFGTIFDVAVDLRRSSPTFRQWVSVTLEAGDGRQLYVPPGFGHGYLSMSSITDVVYKCTTPYHRASDSAIRFDDAELAIEWPVPHGVSPILSPRDRSAPPLASAQLFD